MIFDGRAIADGSPGLDSIDPRSLLLSFYPDARIAPLDHVVLTADPMLAIVQRGHWAAPCACGARPGADVAEQPAPGCIVWLDWPLGWCVRCGNQSHGGGWRPVEIPPYELRVEIERVLLARPDPATRNWEPRETLDELVAENIAHGVEPFVSGSE